MRYKQDWDAKRTKKFSGMLLRWYCKHRRALPWRINPSPYRIWVSEIMLQQTQVKTVIPYFERFMKRFPDIESLSKASEERVFEIWAGLGYYSRARNLLKAARQIVRVHGVFPSEFKTVRALPGIGRYTAGAICSLAFNQVQPIVDGNIRRVLIRLHGIKGGAPESYFWNQMSVCIPERRAASFNQAMMELGAMVCVPFRPRCLQCPVESLCKAKEQGIQARIPEARAKPAVKHLKIVTLVLEKDRRVLLTFLGHSHIIPGKWGLPYRLVSNRESAEEAAVILCRSMLGRLLPLEPCAQIRHSISNHRIIVYAFCGNANIPIPHLPEVGKFRWAPGFQSKTKLTSSLFRKVLQKYGELRSLEERDGTVH